MRFTNRLKQAASSAAPFLMLIFLAAFPKQTVSGAYNGVKLCVSSVIPALFPFFTVSSLILKTGAAAQLGNKLSPIMKKIFGLNGVCATSLIMGYIGGYPVGARLVGEMYKTRLCTREEAEAMLIYCNNCGPAFILGAVGAGVFGSARMGIILLVVHIFTSLLIGLVFGRLNAPARFRSSLPGSICFSEAFTLAVKESVLQLLSVCGFVIFFSTLSALIKTDNSIFNLCAAVLLEISNAAQSVKTAPLSLPMMAAVSSFALGWGGFSVHFQTMSVLSDTGLHIKKYYFGKLLHGILSGAISYVIFHAIPIGSSVFRTDSTPSVTAQQLSGGAAVSCCVIACVCLLILWAKYISRRTH